METMIEDMYKEECSDQEGKSTNNNSSSSEDREKVLALMASDSNFYNKIDGSRGDDGGSFVAVRRSSQHLDRTNTCHTDEVVVGSTAWLGRSLSCVCVQRKEGESRPSFDLTPAQEDCLQRLQNRLDIAYDGSVPEHQEALRALWKAAFPEEELRDLISEQTLPQILGVVGSYHWRICCFSPGISRNHFKIFFANRKMLDLEAVKPRTFVGATFLKFLSENESAFDLLYCITFKLMDHRWLAMHASYMDFNAVMKSTRRQLERELLQDDVTRLEDLPSFSLLTRST
nr:hypothetical protein [Tanacetum cinerariifolium]